MNEKKYVVPEGMMKAATQGATAYTGVVCFPATIQAAIEAALRWLAENPIVPTHEQMRDWCDKNRVDCHAPLFPYAFQSMADWQRRMFLAPEPEIPEALKDLLQGDRFGDPIKPQITTNKAWNEAILEAYRRGTLSHGEKKEINQLQ